MQIRNTKLECAEQAMDAIIDCVSVTGDYSGSVAVVGRWSCRYGSGLLSGQDLAQRITIYEKRERWAVLSALSFLTSELMTVSLQRMLLYLKN